MTTVVNHASCGIVGGNAFVAPTISEYAAAADTQNVSHQARNATGNASTLCAQKGAGGQEAILKGAAASYPATSTNTTKTGSGKKQKKSE